MRCQYLITIVMVGILVIVVMVVVLVIIVNNSLTYGSEKQISYMQ